MKAICAKSPLNSNLNNHCFLTTENRERTKSQKIINPWEIILGALAIIDLISCLSYLSGISFSSIFTKSPVSNNDRQQNADKNGLIDSFGPRHDIQETTSKIFMLALCIHAIFISWNKALHRKGNDNENKNSGKNSLKDKTRIVVAFLLTLCLRFAMLPLIKTTSFAQKDGNLVVSMFSFFHKEIHKHLKENPVEYLAQTQTLSLGEALLLTLNAWFKSSALVLFRKQWKKFVRKVFTRIATFAVKNPFQVRKKLIYLRWIRCLFPFIGIFNKLKGNSMDLIKKWEQRRRSKRAALSWKNLLNSLSSEERLRVSTIRIQSNFRARRERRAAQLLREIKQKEEENAIKKARDIFYAKAKLRKIRSASPQQSQSRHRSISREERESFVLLKEELKKPNITNRKLLLKPNTTFSVVWKTLAVSCIVVEIFQLVFFQYFAVNAKLSLDEVLDYFFTSKNKCESLNAGKVHFIKKFQTFITDFVHLSLVSSETICEQPPLWKQMTLSLVKGFSIAFILLFKMITFMDVFITFFTGEIDPSNGALIPKPFITRWFLPGIILQLLVNPAMKEALVIAKKLMRFFYAAGPCRVFHAAIAINPIIHLGILKTVTTLVPFLNQKHERIGKQLTKKT